MQEIDRLEIRLLFESDIPAAMKLKEAAGWNQTENDWRRLLTLEPNGCFGAILDGSLIGTTTTTTYANELAWIGMVLVDPQHRGRGVATQLMKTAMDYLDGKVATIKLDATAQGKSLYEKFGFAIESLVERWSRASQSTSPATRSKPRNDEARREILELDKQAFLGDRSTLIELLIDDAIISPVLARRSDEKLSGFALARRGTRANYIGPIVTTEVGEIENLLDQTLDQIGDSNVYLDFSHECGPRTSILSDREFVKERDLIRMSTGTSGNKTSPLVVAIAGPEVG
jgi:GNAT superfamily N-acetyltransferase